MRVSAERAEVPDSLFFPSSFMCLFLRPHLHLRDLGGPQPQSSKHAAGTTPALFPGCRRGMEAGTQGQGREGRPPWGPLCTDCPSPTARPLSAHRACAKSSDPLTRGIVFQKLLEAACGLFPEAATARGRPHSPCDFCLGSRDLPGTFSPTPTLAAQMGSLRWDLKLTLA